MHSVTGRSHLTYADAVRQIDDAVQRGMTQGQIERAQGAGDLPALLKPLFHEVFDTLYTYAWFVGFLVAFVAYALLMARDPSVRADRARTPVPKEGSP